MDEIKKIAIIGASYLQEPLIRKAQSMGLKTIVFAWKVGDIGEKIADKFYPISIVEKEKILEICQNEKISGICSIASDLASITVNYVANAMGLIANSIESTYLSTNKHLMREAFEKNNDPSPKSILIKNSKDERLKYLEYPLIVKPVDRSGSRGITKIDAAANLSEAIEAAKKVSFTNEVLVEEFVDGKEYSVEYISVEGIHHFLNITEKLTTGAPHFIEIGHIEPADISDSVKQKIKKIVPHALDSLKVKNGASHTELKISSDGEIKLIEIGARMGGDFIGSDLVELSTGFDFVAAVIKVALGETINFKKEKIGFSCVRFIMNKEDACNVKKIVEKNHNNIVKYQIDDNLSEEVIDSSSRHGYCVFKANSLEEILSFMPKEEEK